uniref:RST domain-containing protein n=1 Tax=Panagrellus redivivus TaxID=6233 RepID=A0A7E5A1M4_PANRE
MCIMQKLQFPRFVEAIGKTSGYNKFRTALLTFLRNNSITTSMMEQAKTEFMATVYNKQDLYGSEQDIVLSHLSKDFVVGGKLVCKDTKCKKKKKMEIDALLFRHYMSS